MYDVSIRLPNQPGSLAKMGEVLGAAGVSIEGGGAFVVNGDGIAHFLFEDGVRAQQAMESAEIEVLAVREVIVQRLKQDVPGQLGKLTRMMADADVNIDVMYSDHNNQLILVVDDPERGRQVSQQWTDTTWK